MIKFSRSLAILFIAFAVASCGSADKKAVNDTIDPGKSEAVNYTIDTDKSKVMWTGTMLGMYAHEGTLNFIEGGFTMSDGKLADGKFLVDMNSINPTDDGYDPEAGKGPEVLVGHLSSDDFFNVAEFPTSMLTIDNGAMTLKIRDKENPVELKDFKFSEEGDLLKAKGKLTFDRKEFNVSFDHPAKEMILSDKVELEVTIEAFKN